jgi:signal transduction histidine kinase/ActR/RegA family two-component response regulator
MIGQRDIQGRLNALMQAGWAVASCTDLEQVLQNVVHEAAAISGAPFVRLFLLDEGSHILRCRVGVGLPREEEDGLLVPLGQSFSDEVIATGRPLAIPDTREDPRLLHPLHATKWGMISYLGIPLTVEDRPVGVLVFNTREVRAYTDEEITYLSCFASQAGIAMLNARLLQAAGRRQQQLKALLKATGTIMSELTLQRILEQVTEEASRIAGCEHVKLLLVDREARVLRVGVLRGRTFAAGFPLPLGTGLSGIVAETGRPLFVPDTWTHLDSALAEQDKTLGIRTYLGLPITFHGEVLGVLTFNTEEPREYTPEELEYLASFADHAALAIVRARLHEKVKAHAAELEARVKERTLELEEALRVKEEFLARMSHEFRTPLNFVLGFADLLVREAAGPLTPTQARYLNRIQMGGQHLLDLVNDLLDLTSPAISAELLRQARFPLRDLFQDILDLLQSQIAAKQLKMVVTIPPMFQVVADRSKLAQVLRHLVSNAVKFTPDGGRVSLAARELADDQSHPDLPAGRVVEISVADSGVGIAAENLNRVFEVFEQADGSSERAYDGSGLGLTLVRKLVELHGGVVWAESPGVGHGTRIIVRLPQGGMVPAAKQILVVEDDPTMLRFYAVFLGEAGYEVTAVGSAGAALAALQAGPIDLVILDLGLPDRPGIDVLRQMRADPKTKAVPVLVLTGRGEAEVEEALREGASECVTKPTTGSALIHVVHTLLKQVREGTALDTADTGRDAPGGSDGV